MGLVVTAYTTSWCPDCVRSRRVLYRAGLTFCEIDIERTTGSEDEMRALNGDSGKVPTILLESEKGRKVLIEPSDRELNAAIRALQTP